MRPDARLPTTREMAAGQLNVGSQLLEDDWRGKPAASMSSRPIPFYALPAEEVNGWRPVDFADGEGAIRASVAHFVKLVRDLVQRDSINRSRVDKDSRVMLARALGEAFLAHGQRADSYAFLNQQVARQLGVGEEKDRATKDAWDRLTKLLSSKTDEFARSFHAENLAVVVFVRYYGEGRDNNAYFQPWVRVRPIQSGVFSFPDFDLALPLRVSPRYAPLIDPAAASGNPLSATAAPSVENRAGNRLTEGVGQLGQPKPTESTGQHGIAAERGHADPSPGQSGNAAPSQAFEPPSWSGQKMLDLLIQDLIEERRDSQRFSSPWWWLFGIFGCCVAVFHIVMYFLEANGIIVRGQ